MSRDARCRLCGGDHLARLFSLRDLPISHDLRKSLTDPDPRFNVDFDACEECGLLQIVDAIPAELIYGTTDTYTTGFQRPKHLEDLITTTVARQDPGKAVDVGCNDGTLMDALQRAGYRGVVGVEPNPLAAATARGKGHRVYGSYLTEALAAQIVADNGEFDTVYLRHVVEHVSELEPFFRAIRKLLHASGVVVLELPEVEEAFRLGSPAVLWEEHVSYFTQAQAEYLLERYGFHVCDRRRYVFGGGSIGLVARRVPTTEGRAVPLPVPALQVLHRFVSVMARQISELRELMQSARAVGFQVLVFGAGPRSCLVVSTSRIDGMIDFVVDDREEIQHRLMPGTNLVVRSLTEVAVAPARRLLCLLGVGCENEFRVRARVEAAHGGHSVFVSLFPPRDTLASIARARGAISNGHD